MSAIAADDDSSIREHVSASLRLSLSTNDTGPSAAFTCFTRISSPFDAMFAGRADGAVITWRIPTIRQGVFKEHFVLGSHKGNVTAIAFQARHGVLVTGSSDCAIKLWDALAGESGGRCVQSVPAHDATVTALAVLSDVVVSASVDKTVKLWRFDPQRAKLCFPWMEVRQVFVLDTWATTLWASSDKVTEASQGEVYVGDSNGNITILRSELETSSSLEQSRVSGLLLKRRIEGKRKQGMVRVSPISLNHVVTIAFDEKARIRDVISFDTLVGIDHPEGKRFVDLAWCDTHEELLLLDVTGYLHVWSTRGNKMVLRHFVGKRATQVDFTKGLVWVAHGQSIDGVAIERTTTFASYAGHTDRIIAVGRLSRPAGVAEDDDDSFPAEYHWVTASADNTVRFWTRKVECVFTMRERQSEITAFVQLQTSPWCVTGHDDGGIKFWALMKDSSFRFSAHDNTVSVVGEGTHRIVRGDQAEYWPHIFTGSFDGCFAIWEMPVEGNKAKCEARVRVSRSEVLSAVYDPMRKAYIVGANDGDVTVWSSDELKPVMRLRSANGPTLPAHSGAVTCIALDGNIAFTGGEDDHVLTWNMVNGEMTRALEFEGAEELGEVQGFKVLPSSGNLLVSTRTGMLALFDQSTGRACWSYSLGREVVVAHFDRRSEELLVGMGDGAVVRLVVGNLDAPGGPRAAAAAAEAAAQAATAAEDGSESGGEEHVGQTT